MAAPPGLTPNDDLRPEADGGYRIIGPAPAFALDAPTLAGRWIVCRANVSSDVAFVGLSIQIRVGGASPRRIQARFSPDRSGALVWFGHVPADAERVQVDVVTTAASFRIRRFEIRRLSRFGIVRRSLMVDPRDTARAVRWRLLGKKVRARGIVENLLRTSLRRKTGARPSDGAAGVSRDDYAQWLHVHDRFSEEDLAALSRRIAAAAEPPLISILMPVYNPNPRDLEEALASVRAQIYPHWQLSVADDASSDPRIWPILEAAAAADPRIRAVRRPANGHIAAASNTALEGCEGAFTALMDHDDLIPPHALLFVAGEIVAHPEVDLIYSDEDKVDERGRRFMPYFKSDWNEELLLAQNYVNHLGVYRTEILRRIGGFRLGFEGSQDHDLILRVLDHTEESRIVHIPRVLYHWRHHGQSFSERSLDRAIAAQRRALADHVARRGWDAEVVDGAVGTNRLVRRLPDPPPEVAVIVPTRDRAGLMRVVTRGLLEETDYPRLRLVVVDNGSVEPETLALFDELRRDPRVTILAAPGPFNYSALNNAAVESVESEVVCLLNNDIEVIDRDWLRELVSQLVPGVAAAGAKLLYPDRTVQHAGVLIGMGGVAGHAFLGLGEDEPGYFGRAVLPQYVSAVTAACMVVRRDAFLEVGGLDAERLAVAFNDVDLCLKLRGRGWKIVFDPYAVLLHHESASRGRETTPEKRARFEREVLAMMERWGARLKRDPYFNPNLEIDSADFQLRDLHG